MKIGKYEIGELRKVIAAGIALVIVISTPKLLQDAAVVNLILLLGGVGGAWGVFAARNDPPKEKP